MIDRPAAAVLAAIATLAAMAALAPFAGAAQQRSTILVLLPQQRGAEPAYDESIAEGLASMPELSLGLTSATQGSYRRGQALLDISQGTRVSRSTYSPEEVPLAGRLLPLRALPPDVKPSSIPPSRSASRLSNWPAILRRAETAPQTIEPGLLAGSIPGGAAFAGRTAEAPEAAIPAADRRGILAAVSPGISPRKAAALADRYGLVVVTASPGQTGLAELRRILALRGADQLVIATQSPPEAAILPVLPIGVAGLEGGPGGLTSATTNLPNLVANIDIAPTVLDHLGVEIPDEMRGRVMRSEGDRDPGAIDPVP